MFTRKRYTVTTEDDIYRVRDEYVDTYVLGLRVKREITEVWRKAATIPDDLRRHVLEEDKEICVYCGQSGNSIDHVVPQKDGGLTAFENLVTACRKCNSSKNGRTPVEAGMAFVSGRYRHGHTSTVEARKKRYVYQFTGNGIMVQKDAIQYPLISHLEQRYGNSIKLYLCGYRDAASSILCDLFGEHCAEKYDISFTHGIVHQLFESDNWTLSGEEIVQWLDRSETNKVLSERWAPLIADRKIK